VFEAFLEEFGAGFFSLFVGQAMHLSGQDALLLTFFLKLYYLLSLFVREIKHRKCISKHIFLDLVIKG
jgi:hypothetical protein